MAIMTYVGNTDDNNFTSMITGLAAGSVFIGDQIDITPAEQAKLAPFYIFKPGAQAVDLSNFPYTLWETELTNPYSDSFGG